MENNQGKQPVKSDTSSSRKLHPVEGLRSQINRLFEDFDRDWHFPFSRRSPFDLEPFFLRDLTFSGSPAVDIIENDDVFELTAELPGLDGKDIEVKVSNGNLVIQGEKRGEREEVKKGLYLSERHYGSFHRTFGLPEGVDPEKIEARFQRGVLTVQLPKRPESKKPERVIPIKAS